MLMIFMKDSKLFIIYKIYNFHRVYGVGDLFGDIGGFKESLLMIGAFFVSFFQNALFNSALIKKVY